MKTDLTNPFSIFLFRKFSYSILNLETLHISIYKKISTTSMKQMWLFWTTLTLQQPWTSFDFFWEHGTVTLRAQNTATSDWP